ncbi:MAG: hypothetical protein R2874_07500 [Desulfobacterales bacterium]
MAAGGEKRDQGRSQKTAGPGNQNGFRTMHASCLVGRNIRNSGIVAVGKNTFQGFFHKRRQHGCPQGMQGKGEFNFIFQPGGARPAGFKPVGVNPSGERTFYLNILKHFIFAESYVPGMPFNGHRSGKKPHFYFRAGLNAAGSGDNFKGIPGRAQPLNGPGPGVPLEDGFNGRVDL